MSATGDDLSRGAMVSDADLVIRAQRGEKPALGQLVERYQDRIFNTCYRMCRNHADALDMTQTTILKAMEALPRFEARAGFFTWIFRIAVNVVISHRRSQRRRRETGLMGHCIEGDEMARASGDQPEPTSRLSQQELGQRLEAALGRVDEEYRIAILLRDVEELDYAQISEILDVPVGTVKSRIHRGRTMVREILTGERRMDNVER